MTCSLCAESKFESSAPGRALDWCDVMVAAVALDKGSANGRALGGHVIDLSGVSGGFSGGR